jgi:glycogenin glucosyltransferase
MCVQNPNAKLEQLRRSSLIEIEHLTKDPHPDPPLRALPEHSVLENEESPTVHPALSGGASPHGLDKFDGIDGTAGGIATQDFAQTSGTKNNKTENSVPAATEGLFFTSQGLSSVSSSSFSQTSSSSTLQQTSTSSGQQMQSGRMTFTLPDFGKENESTIANAREEILSPTQPQDNNDEKKGGGLF